MKETYLVSFLCYLDVNPDVQPYVGRIRNMPPRGRGYGSHEETYASRDEALTRLRVLSSAGLIERGEVYESARGYVLGRKIVAEWKEGEDT